MLSALYEVSMQNGICLSNHHVILCKVRLVGAYIKTKEVVNGTRRIISEKLKEYQ